MVHWAYTVGPWPPTAGEGGGVSWRPGIGNFQAGWWLGNLLDAPWVILGGVDLLHDVQASPLQEDHPPTWTTWRRRSVGGEESLVSPMVIHLNS